MKTKVDTIVVHDEPHNGHPISGPKSSWWIIAGLWDGYWVQLYHARDEVEAKRYLRAVWDTEDALEHTDYEDFTIIPPALEHRINKYVQGQYRSYLEAHSPSTLSARRSLSQHKAPVGRRGSAKARRKR